MARIQALLLMAVSLLGAIHAADPDPESLQDYYTSTTDFAKSQGDDFFQAGASAAQGGVGTYHTLFDSFSPNQCGSDWISATGGSDVVRSAWYLPAIFVTVICLIGVGLIYMWGQLFNSPQMAALAKDELFQTALTVGRVMFLVGALGVTEIFYSVNSIDSSDRVYNNVETYSMMDAAMGFCRMMVSDMVNHYSVLILYNMVMHTLYSSTMWIGVTWRAMYSFNLGPVLKPLVDILGSALQYLSLGISEWLMHIATLCIIKRYTWTLFIPMSMLLRAIPQTRSAGEALFALMFALALFYPFMFVMDYEIHKLMKFSLVDSQKAVGNFFASSGILNVLGAALVMTFLMAGVFMPFFLGSALSLAFELVRNAVYYIVIMSVFIPFLNIFITLTAAKEIANFFRVDVNFMSFLKII
ncbi:MAG: hypothetical protein V1827_04280 [Candidatus Micrarchaeota archaeon]